MEPLGIEGVYVLEPDPITDERGFFARIYDAELLASYGLGAPIVQSSVAFNHRAGTLRGMHWQAEPALEAKLVRCTRGAVLDQIVDLRPGSATRLSSVSIELSETNGRTLYVPPLFAHGYQTLLDETEIVYQMSAGYAPDCARGLRFDDPALGLRWPLPVSVISNKDRTWRLMGKDDSPPTRHTSPEDT